MRSMARSERTPGDCLSKTQLRAKPQGDVYGVTLVRCRNVNGGGGVPQGALPTPEAPVNDGSNYNCLKVGNSLLLQNLTICWKLRVSPSTLIL